MRPNFPARRGFLPFGVRTAPITLAIAIGCYYFARPPVPEKQSSDFVNRILRKNEKTLETKSRRLQVSLVPSNSPMEDRYSISKIGDSLVVGVFDGHAGWQCSDLLAEKMAGYIARNYKNDFAAAMTRAYLEIDNDLYNLAVKAKQEYDVALDKTAIKPQLQNKLMPAIAGSVLVTAVVEDKKLHVAHAGDCRAVLGTRRNGQWSAVQLTQDHVASNPSEFARINKEHPNENVIVKGRILGSLQPFRAIGDHRYKWPASLQSFVSTLFSTSDYAYRHEPRMLLTPPYVTAEPQVTTRDLTEEDEFLVLASDGLWDELDSSQVVDIVGAQIEQNTSDNVATSLIRHAFGGSVERVSALLSIPPPGSRYYRDDITVLVVFLKNKHAADSEITPADPTAHL